MKSFKQLSEELNEISTRMLSKYVKLEPKAQAQGAVGELKGDKKLTDKADKHLKNISKVKSKLDTMKPAHESEDLDTEE